MALIKCPECGKEISDKAPACIHCGFPLSELADSIPETKTNKEVVYVDSNDVEDKLIFTDGIQDGADGFCIWPKYEMRDPYCVKGERLYIKRTREIEYIISDSFLIPLHGKCDGMIPEHSLFNAVCKKENFGTITFKESGKCILSPYNSAGRYVRENNIIAYYSYSEAQQPNYYIIYNGELYDWGYVRKESIDLLKSVSCKLGQPNVFQISTKQTITCPYCQSTDCKKISSFSKAGSVALWGILALGKTTKQWHCNKCKSDF